MNLVGHVVAALTPDHVDPPVDFLVGCMLPDLAAITRVRLARPLGELGRGVDFHHTCDSVFHESEWFRTTMRDVRDALIDAGIERGAARACSHAGVEMLLDGALVDDHRSLDAARRTLAAVARDADALASLAPVETRTQVAARFRMIGTSLDPVHYRDAQLVSDRLQRMTAGRRRIELPVSRVDVVAAQLRSARPGIAAAAASVLVDVRAASDQAPG